MQSAATVTQLLFRWSQGDPVALEELAPRVQKELRSLARFHLKRRRPNHTLQPTALINEAWVRLIDQSAPIQWENRSHFFGIAARLMRFVLVDYAKKRHAMKRGGGMEPITLGHADLQSLSKTTDILEVNEALEQLAKVDARKAEVIELRYFGGMSREEIGSALGLTLPTVKRDLRLGEYWLRRFLAGTHPKNE
jgi:RNA polymerase sigma factor (TIGR02999 family)